MYVKCCVVALGGKAKATVKSKARNPEPEVAQFRFSKDSKGGPQTPAILTGGFTFVKEREFANGRTRWRCSHASGTCRANIYTIESDVVLFYDKHDHT